MDRQVCYWLLRGLVPVALLIAAVGAGLLSEPQIGRATYPGQNGRIAFRSADDNIVSIKPDGSDLLQLTTGDDNAHPVWSADGTEILFTGERDGNREVYRMNADGSHQTRITNNSADDARPVLSPDGTKIVFDTDHDGNREIYVMDANGDNPTNVSNNPAFEREAQWSPDGTKISFESDRDGGVDDDTDIFVIDANGDNPVNLTNTPDEYEGDANWSPDGAKLIFEGDGTGGNGDVFVIDEDGQNRANITQTAGNEADPVFSPDGTKIVFYAFTSPADVLWTMDANGDNPKQLTFQGGSFAGDMPDWAPLLLRLGDVNCDGQITGPDPLDAMLTSLGLPFESECTALTLAAAGAPGDADCDGDIDVEDAVAILHYLAGVPADPAVGCDPIGTLLT